jgi:ankyrin repeat protein
MLRGGCGAEDVRAPLNASASPALVRFTIGGTELTVPVSEINAPFHDAPTPLFAAAAEGEVGAIEALLAGGADPRATDADGDTPLTIAAFNGAPDAALASLVAHGAALAHRNRFGATPLHAAAAAGSAAAARALVRLGADVAAVDASGLTARAMAEGCDHEGEILDALAPAGPAPPP